MANTLYSFLGAEAKAPSPTVINDAIAFVMRANKEACYVEMERYLVAPDITGSRFFDQHEAVCILLKHDELEAAPGVTAGGGRIKELMKETPSMTQAFLWQRLCIVLRKTGFNMKQGRVVGMIEKRQTEAVEDKSTVAYEAETA